MSVFGEGAPKNRLDQNNEPVVLKRKHINEVLEAVKNKNKFPDLERRRLQREENKQKQIKDFVKKLSIHRSVSHTELERLFYHYEDLVEKTKKRTGETSDSNNLFQVKEEFLIDDYQNFNNLYSLMWYYYYTNRGKYKGLLAEYEKRFDGVYKMAAGMRLDKEKMAEGFLKSQKHSESLPQIGPGNK